MLTRKIGFAFVLLAATLAVAACSGSDEGVPASAVETRVPQPAARVATQVPSTPAPPPPGPATVTPIPSGPARPSTSTPIPPPVTETPVRPIATAEASAVAASAAAPPTATLAPPTAVPSAPAPAVAAAPGTPIPSTPVPEPTETPTATPVPTVTVEGVDKPPLWMTLNWSTDFTKHSVPFSEITRGGPPRDGIPPIDNPKFETVSDAPDYFVDHEPVLAVEFEGDARAYPIAILMWHEIVNDDVGGVPITVTYCPLCNTAIVFDRRVGDRVLDFGTSGALRRSDLVMWDRQTQSWWQQITGEAIIGEYTGTKLTFLPAPMISWVDFKSSYPEGKVLSRDTGHSRDYGHPPYAGYDGLASRPFLYFGQLDDRLVPMERVVGINVGEQSAAYPFPLFESSPVVNDTVFGQDVAIFYASETLSGFETPYYAGPRVVGSTGVYDPNLVGTGKLTFRLENDSILDDQTGSKWTILGEAVEGPLAGQALKPLIHANHFWFAWQAFFPETEVRAAEDLVG